MAITQISNGIINTNINSEVPGCHIKVIGQQVRITIPSNSKETIEYIFPKKEVKELFERMYTD